MGHCIVTWHTYIYKCSKSQHCIKKLHSVMEFWSPYQLEAGDMSCSRWRTAFSYRSDNYQTTGSSNRSWWHHKANGKSQVSGEASWKVVNPSHGLYQVCCLLWSHAWAFGSLSSHSNTAVLPHTGDWLRRTVRRNSLLSSVKSIHI